MLVCPACNRQYPEGENYCSKCGKRLVSPQGDEGIEEVGFSSHCAETLQPSETTRMPVVDLTKTPLTTETRTPDIPLEALPEEKRPERSEEAPLKASYLLPTLIDGQYRVVSQVPNEGSEADTYVCQDTKTGEKVVVKYYRVRISPASEVLERLSGIDHEDILTIHKYGFWNGRLYEVQEFAEGGSLYDCLPFDEDEIVNRLLPQIHNGLKFLHTKGIVHCDVKPQNIFFRDQERSDLVLGDFGISSIIGPGKFVETSRLRGTDVYIAPETYTGIFNEKSDYYSLGITLMHLIMGDHPFVGMSPQEIQFHKLFGQIDLPENVSQRFKALLKGLTLRKFEKRWGDKEISRWLKGEEVKVEEDEVTMPVFYYKISEGKIAYDPGSLGKLLYEDFSTGLKHLKQKLLINGIVPYDQDLAMRIEEISDKAPNPEAALIEIIYTLNPGLPYRLGTFGEAKNARDLVGLIDSTPECWEEGKRHLREGYLHAWLRGTGREDILQALEKVKLSIDPGEGQISQR